MFGIHSVLYGLPRGHGVKNPPASAGILRRCGFDPWIRKIPLEEELATHSIFLPGESHGQRSLVGHSPWGHTELNMTEATLHTGTQLLGTEQPFTNVSFGFSCTLERDMIISSTH